MGQWGNVDLLIIVIVGIAVLIVLFAVLRTFALWYFKIDRIVALLEKMTGVDPDIPTKKIHQAQKENEPTGGET